MKISFGKTMAQACRNAERAEKGPVGGDDGNRELESLDDKQFAGFRIPEEAQANARVFDLDPERRTFTLNIRQAGGEIDAEKMAEKLGLQIVNLGNRYTKLRVPDDLPFEDIVDVAKKAAKKGTYAW